jgi:hypothetical protein
MIRTTTLLLAGTLFTAGCQHAVYGDRSFRSDVSGADYEFPRTPVSGEASFRNRVNAPDDLTRPETDSARAASDRVASSPPPRTEVSTRRAEQPSSDNPRDEVSRSTVTAETDSGAPRSAASGAPEQPKPPVATADNPTPPRDADPAASAARTPAGRDPERVARANTARYPDDLKPSDDLHAAATIDRATRTLRVTNYSSKDVRGGDLWVSETFVTPIPDLAAGASVSVPLDGFYDRDGHRLPALADTGKLQLQSAGKLYNIPLQSDDLNK